MARKIILDCDPGHDDAVAILLAHGSPAVELLAVTAVAGNHTLEDVTRNARAVMTVAGVTGVPVAAGADRPLTDIALAARREPAIVDRVAEVVLMGGGYSRGNTTPAAEFDAPTPRPRTWSSTPWDVTMVPLELTHQATATPDVLARIAAPWAPGPRG